MDQAWKSFDTKFLPQWKDWKSSYELGQKPLIFIFSSFLLVLSKFIFWEKVWVLGYDFMMSEDFPDLS